MHFQVSCDHKICIVINSAVVYLSTIAATCVFIQQRLLTILWRLTVFWQGTVFVIVRVSIADVQTVYVTVGSFTIAP